MLRQFHDLKNFTLATRDGEIGKIKELYFDDVSWTVRYIVVDTGTWLMDRQVLIAPAALGAIDAEHHAISVQLTKEQIQQSPPIDADMPVSRQHEIEWHQYYGYPGYWLSPASITFGAAPMIPVPVLDVPHQDLGDPHLRSLDEVHGYTIHASDGGEIGKVDDLILDDQGWAIRYFVVSLGWLGKKFIFSPEWVKTVSWDDASVFVSLDLQTIQEAPEWTHDQPMTREYEQQLHDYYGRRAYWPVAP